MKTCDVNQLSRKSASSLIKTLILKMCIIILTGNVNCVLLSGGGCMVKSRLVSQQVSVVFFYLKAQNLILSNHICRPQYFIVPWARVLGAQRNKSGSGDEIDLANHNAFEYHKQPIRSLSERTCHQWKAREIKVTNPVHVRVMISQSINRLAAETSRLFSVNVKSSWDI